MTATQLVILVVAAHWREYLGECHAIKSQCSEKLSELFFPFTHYLCLDLFCVILCIEQHSEKYIELWLAARLILLWFLKNWHWGCGRHTRAWTSLKNRDEPAFEFLFQIRLQTEEMEHLVTTEIYNYMSDDNTETKFNFAFNKTVIFFSCTKCLEVSSEETWTFCFVERKSQQKSKMLSVSEQSRKSFPAPVRNVFCWAQSALFRTVGGRATPHLGFEGVGCYWRLVIPVVHLVVARPDTMMHSCSHSDVLWHLMFDTPSVHSSCSVVTHLGCYDYILTQATLWVWTWDISERGQVSW